MYQNNVPKRQAIYEYLHHASAFGTHDQIHHTHVELYHCPEKDFDYYDELSVTHLSLISHP